MATFSVTDRGTFRRCRRRWDYSSNMRRNLTNVGSGPEPLELGSLIHRALADWIVHYESEDAAVRDKARSIEPVDVSFGAGDKKTAAKMWYLPYLFMQHASSRQEEIKSAFREKYGYEANSELLASLHNVVELGMAMMKNYQMFHQSPIPNHMQFAVPEQEVLIPVPGTEHYLSATLDGLLQDDKGLLYVLEHKTYENRPQPVDLHMNDQFTGYAWVVRELGIGTVAGVAYDGMWKRAEPAKYMRKERRAGTLADLFIRKILPKSDAELDEWGRNLPLEINEMANNPVIYPNVPWQGCNDCNFQDVCIMQMRGEDPSNLIQMKYTQREVVRGGQQTAV